MPLGDNLNWREGGKEADEGSLPLAVEIFQGES